MKYQIKVFPNNDLVVINDFDSLEEARENMRQWIAKFEMVFKGADFKRLGSVESGFIRFDHPHWSSSFAVALVKNK